MPKFVPEIGPISFFGPIELPPCLPQLRNDSEARLIENKDTVQVPFVAGHQHCGVVDVDVGWEEANFKQHLGPFHGKLELLA